MSLIGGGPAQRRGPALPELPISPRLPPWRGQIFEAQAGLGYGGEGLCEFEEGQLRGAVSCGPLGRGGRRTSAGLSPRSELLGGQVRRARTVGPVLQEQEIRVISEGHKDLDIWHFCPFF